METFGDPAELATGRGTIGDPAELMQEKEPIDGRGSYRAMMDLQDELNRGEEVPAVDALQDMVFDTIKLLDMWMGSWHGKRRFTASDIDDIRQVEFLGGLSAVCFRQFQKEFGRYAEDGNGESC